jgi:ribonuclease BN (tRNA processing enzyme)
METCLGDLWEILRAPISEIVEQQNGEFTKRDALAEKCDAAEKSNNLIKEFFSDLSECFGTEKELIEIPEHVVIFQQSLEKFCEKSVDGVKEGAKLAKREIAKCGLCAVCTGCSNKFYDDIIGEEMKEKSLPFELENYFLMPSQMYYYQQSMYGASEHFRLENRLLCLKGFSSSTPTIHSIAFDSECVGGGLYINYKGLGIVIDPGIGFVNSMHKNGIYINDIDIVIITHDHLDHNADAKVISSLLYDLNNYNRRKNKIVKEVFELEKTKEHTITWIVDDGTRASLEKSASDIRSLGDFVERNSRIVEGSKEIKMEAIRTKHIKDSNETYGIRLSMNYETQMTIGYTSDTAFFPGLSSFFSGSDILIFNVSDIYRKDVKGIQDKHSHLGYNGSIKLLKEAKPGLAIASEFCCTNGDFRMAFMNTLSEELKGQSSTILGEVGLNISIPQIEVECSFCKKMEKIADTKIVAPRWEYGKVQYACRHCAKNMV